MLTIYKYKLHPDTKSIEIPSMKILSAESQNEDIVIYALVDTDAPPRHWIHLFRVYGTGHEIDCNLENFKFLNTVKMSSDSLMFHVFHRIEGEIVNTQEGTTIILSRQ